MSNNFLKFDKIIKLKAGAKSLTRLQRDSTPILFLGGVPQAQQHMTHNTSQVGVKTLM